MSASWRPERRGALIAFLIHLTVVLVVLVLCETDSDPDIIIWWSIFFYIDYPVVMLVELFHPSYNVPVAIALIVAGGVQWTIALSLLVFILRRVLKRRF
jgi:hypothetical protein